MLYCCVILTFYFQIRRECQSEREHQNQDVGQWEVRPDEGHEIQDRQHRRQFRCEAAAFARISGTGQQEL